MNKSTIEAGQPEQQPNSGQKVQNKQVSPSIANAPVIGGFVMVSEHKRFIFEEMCPYCGGDLTYTACGWEKDDNGLWMADSFDSECSTMPDIEDEDEWDEWAKCHSEMPYVHQLPVEEAAKKYINSKYRFELKH